MAKFCRNCGQGLKDDALFCPGCGEPIRKEPMQHIAGIGQKGSRGISKEMMIPIIVAFAFIIGGGIFFMQSDKVDSKEPVAKETVSAALNITPTPSAAAKKTPLELTKEEVQKYGFSDKILATTYGDNDNGYLAIEGGKGVRILLIDKKNQRIAIVSPRMSLSKYAQQRNQKVPEALIADFLVLKDTHGADDQYGSWQGENHQLPIYALYQFDSSGQVIPGRLTSGTGKKPSHFQDFLYEQKNVDMANLFLVEALPLLCCGKLKL